MATILKVHGTFASGPEEGVAWWQRGSECCSHVGELVEAADGKLRIEQFVWDGLNSERSRQAAANALLERITSLEAADEPYCVVGHSHGGSVIAAALLRAAFYKRPLEKLSRWITIGTPFIEAKRSRLLFARLGPGGKTAFLSVVAFFAAFAILAARTPTNVQALASGEGGISLIGLAAGFAIGLLIFCYPILWLLARNRLHWHNHRIQEAARKSFAGRWLSLRHEDDEAVQGLRAFQSIKHPIFPRDFAVSALSRLAIIVVPLAIYLALVGLSRMGADGDGYFDNAPPPAQSTTAPVTTASGSVKGGAHVVKQAPPSTASPTASTPSGTPSSVEPMTVRLFLITIAVMFVIFIGIPMAMYHLVRLAAWPTSIALSHGLNAMTWSQVRRTSLGSDIDGEAGRHARDHPVWIDKPSRPLPRRLAAELTAVSDAAAASSLTKFRAALSELSFYRLDQGGRDALNAFLTGEELIHTTYFKIPRFRKLLAYSIAQSPGFRPSAALRNDPDFPIIEQWYRELTAETTPPPLPQSVQPAVVLQSN